MHFRPSRIYFSMAWCAANALSTLALLTLHAAAKPLRTPWISVFTTLITESDALEQKMIIQENTIVALQSLQPFVDITVYTNSTIGQRLCKQLNVRCSDRYNVNTHGTPTLKSMYLDVERRGEPQFYGYMNADILFDSSLLTTLSAVRQAMHRDRLSPQVLVIGRRYNFDMPHDLNQSSNFCLKSAARADFSSALQIMRANASIFMNYALDFFFVTKGTFDWASMPDFVVGRPVYDNCLVNHAIQSGVSVVDATSSLHPIHQTGVDGNKAGHRDVADADWNKDIVSRGDAGNYFGGACDAAWKTVVKNERVLVVRRHLPGLDAECQDYKSWLHPSKVN